VKYYLSNAVIEFRTWLSSLKPFSRRVEQHIGLLHLLAFVNMSSVDAHEIAKTAKVSFEGTQLIPSSERIGALHAIKAELDFRRGEILAANKEDLKVIEYRTYLDCPP
jgi:hypothetical protein